jgi:hypothetical protein
MSVPTGTGANRIERSSGRTSALAFHEKSGRCQGILWLGKFISMFSFCPDMYFVWLASRAVKAERSEFILSLDGPTSQP